MQFRHWLGAAALACLPALAQADITTFSFDAVIDFVDQPPDIPGGFPPEVALGATLHLSYSFDSAAAVIGSRTDAGGGVRLSYDPSSLVVSLSLADIHSTVSTAQALGGQIIGRDNSPDPDAQFNGERGAGLTPAVVDLRDPNVQTSFQLTLHGPVLDLVTGGGALPTSQDPRWAGLRVAGFGRCRSSPLRANRCDLGGFSAQISAVPEPATGVLAALGLATVGGVARRRRGDTTPQRA